MANFFEKLKKGMDIEEVPETEDTEPEPQKADFADLELKEEPIEPEETPEETPTEKETPAEETPEENPEEIEEPAQEEDIETNEETGQTPPEEKPEMKEEEPPKAEIVTAGISFLKPKKKTKKQSKKEISKKTKTKKISVKKEKKSTKSSDIKTDKWPGPEGQLVIDLYQANGDIVIQSAVGGIEPENLDVSIENDMVKIKGSRENTYEKNEKNYFYQECHWGSFSREVILPVEINAGKAEANIKNGILTIRMPKIEKVEKRKLRIKEEE